MKKDNFSNISYITDPAETKPGWKEERREGEHTTELIEHESVSLKWQLVLTAQREKLPATCKETHRSEQPSHSGRPSYSLSTPTVPIYFPPPRAPSPPAVRKLTQYLQLFLFCLQPD